MWRVFSLGPPKSRLRDWCWVLGSDTRKEKWGREHYRGKGGKLIQGVLMRWLPLRPTGAQSCWGQPEYASELSCQGTGKSGICLLTWSHWLRAACAGWATSQGKTLVWETMRPGLWDGTLSAIIGTVPCSCRWAQTWVGAARVSALVGHVQLHDRRLWEYPWLPWWF